MNEINTPTDDDTRSCPGPYPTAACPEFHISYRLGRELFTLILWNSEVQCRIHKNAPIIPIQSSINPIRFSLFEHSSKEDYIQQFLIVLERIYIYLKRLPPSILPICLLILIF